MNLECIAECSEVSRHIKSLFSEMFVHEKVKIKKTLILHAYL